MKEAGDIKDPIPNDAAFLGVLSLDGSIKPVDGMLPAIIAARRKNIKILYLPPFPDIPFPDIDGMELRFVETLQDVIASFSGQLNALSYSSFEINPGDSPPPKYDKDFQHVLGHKQAKRALEMAAAGGHHVLMVGPPGCGKSLLAETFSSILPQLKQESQFDVMSIYQLADVTHPHNQIPPFRDPHHSASAVSLIGGGANPKPGEVSLAHRGVLFLDELAEFPKRTLDMLRQPLETGKVTISRAASTVTYPARFLLLGAMNPCPCGYSESRHFYCTCTPKQITKYNNRVSGPIQDRMDILLKLESVSLDRESDTQNESSASIRDSTTQACERQHERYSRDESNATIPNEMLLKAARLSEEQQKMLRQWASDYHWSTRVQMKILRLARTISDLGAEDHITNEAIWEAVTMRRSQGIRRQKGMVT